MFNSDILDLAITLCFIYFLLALAASTISELINSLFNIRSIYLKKALKTMSFDKSWEKIYDELIKSPYITSLMQTENKLPSYIPAKNFALGITNIIRNKQTLALDSTNILNFLNQNETIKDGAREMLIGILHDTGNDYSKFMNGLETLFDNSMDRVSGWFKRSNRWIMMFLCLALTIALNVDTIQISTFLWKDKNALKRATDMSIELKGQFGNKKTDISSVNGKDTTKDLFKETVSGLDSIKHVQSIIKELPVPIGWNIGNYPECNSKDSGTWLSKIAGWLLTALALFLGAPFWFDTMNKFINIRGTGNKPEKTDDKKIKND